jgi:hypothetical protein
MVEETNPKKAAQSHGLDSLSFFEMPVGIPDYSRPVYHILYSTCDRG